MTNKIEISRALLHQIDDLLYIMTGHDSYQRLVQKYGKDWWGPIDAMRAELCTSIAAPVVERKPDAIIEGVMTSVGITHAIYASTVSLKDKEQVKLYTAPASQLTLPPEQFEAIEALLKENPASQNAALQDLLARTSRWDAPVAVDAAKAFTKGFNTLETVDGKYKIVMQFAGRDDAWSAYTALSKLTASLAKPL
jgi:hypothetical protein